MKFGPSPFTYDLVINKLSTSGIDALSTFSIAEHVEQAVNMGFTHFEIGLDIFQTFPIPISEEEIANLHRLKINKSISYSCHLPYYSIDLAGPNQWMREGSRKALVNSYRSIQGLDEDIECYVLHPIGENTTEILNYVGNTQVKSVAADIFKQNAIKNIHTFIEDTGIDPKKLALENLEFPLEPTLEIIRETGTRFCLDTAHLLGGLAGSWDLCKVLTENYDLITEIHLQDYNHKNPMNDHASLGFSGMFPQEFIEILVSRGFNGPLVFELSYEEIKESCLYLQTYFPHLGGLPEF